MFESLGALAFDNDRGICPRHIRHERENMSSMGILSTEASDTKLLREIVGATAKKHDQGEVRRSRPQQDVRGDGERSSLQDRLPQHATSFRIRMNSASNRLLAETSHAQEVTLN